MTLQYDIDNIEMLGVGIWHQRFAISSNSIIGQLPLFVLQGRLAICDVWYLIGKSVSVSYLSLWTIHLPTGLRNAGCGIVEMYLALLNVVE